MGDSDVFSEIRNYSGLLVFHDPGGQLIFIWNQLRAGQRGGVLIVLHIPLLSVSVFLVQDQTHVVEGQVPSEFSREASQELIELLLSAYSPEYAEQRFDFTNNGIFQTERSARFRQEGGRERRISMFWLAQRKINHSHKCAPENISFV